MKARVLCCVCASLVSVAVPAHHAESQQLKLRAALQVAATDPYLGVSLVWFKEEVEARTEKAVTVEILDKGKPYADNQIVEAVTSDAVEMGVAGFHYLAARLPAIDIIQQPFLFNFEALIRAAASPDSELRKLVDKAVLETVGVRVLWWQSAGNQVFFSKGRDAAEPLQIKDQSVRVFSETMAAFTQGCGGRPTMLAAAKTHEAFKDSTIDMAMGAVPLVTNRKLWEVSDTITQTEHSPIEYFLIVNERTWTALSPSHRTIISEAGRTAERKIRSAVAEIEAQTLDFAREKGMKVQQLTPDQVAEWRVCSADLIDEYMRRNAELGRQLMAAYGRLRTDPCCSAGPPGTFHRR
jgi:C4-dicarboxylate-binding protein DctP